MAIDLLAYAVMGNHLHLVVRLRPDVVAGWDQLPLMRHAFAILPIRSGPGLQPLAVTAVVLELASMRATNRDWPSSVSCLSSPSWLLRLVNQETARRANQEDGSTGHFRKKPLHQR